MNTNRKQLNLGAQRGATPESFDNSQIVELDWVGSSWEETKGTPKNVGLDDWIFGWSHVEPKRRRRKVVPSSLMMHNICS